MGTKLELVIMEMAQRIQDRATVVRGALVVEPSDNYFWFSRPQWILFLIHFTLFQVKFLILLHFIRMDIDTIRPFQINSPLFFFCSPQVKIYFLF